MDKERKPEERMNQGPLVPEQVGNLPKTMKMLDAFLIALLVLSSTIVVALFGHHISAIFTGGVSAIFTGGGFAIVKHDCGRRLCKVDTDHEWRSNPYSPGRCSRCGCYATGSLYICEICGETKSNVSLPCGGCDDPANTSANTW